MNRELTIQDHIISLLDEGYTPEQAALKLCERLNNYIPFKQFRKQATDLAVAMESKHPDPRDSGDQYYNQKPLKPKGLPFVPGVSDELDNPSKAGDEHGRRKLKKTNESYIEEEPIYPPKSLKKRIDNFFGGRKRRNKLLTITKDDGYYANQDYIEADKAGDAETAKKKENRANRMISRYHMIKDKKGLLPRRKARGRAVSQNTSD